MDSCTAAMILPCSAERCATTAAAAAAVRRAVRISKHSASTCDHGSAPARRRHRRRISSTAERKQRSFCTTHRTAPPN